MLAGKVFCKDPLGPGTKALVYLRSRSPSSTSLSRGSVFRLFLFYADPLADPSRTGRGKERPQKAALAPGFRGAAGWIFFSSWSAGGRRLRALDSGPRRILLRVAVVFMLAARACAWSSSSPPARRGSVSGREKDECLCRARAGGLLGAPCGPAAGVLPATGFGRGPGHTKREPPRRGWAGSGLYPARAGRGGRARTLFSSRGARGAERRRPTPTGRESDASRGPSASSILLPLSCSRYPARAILLPLSAAPRAFPCSASTFYEKDFLRLVCALSLLLAGGGREVSRKLKEAPSPSRP